MPQRIKNTATFGREGRVRGYSESKEYGRGSVIRLGHQGPNPKTTEWRAADNIRKKERKLSRRNLINLKAQVSRNRSYSFDEYQMIATLYGEGKLGNLVDRYTVVEAYRGFITAIHEVLRKM